MVVRRTERWQPENIKYGVKTPLKIFRSPKNIKYGIKKALKYGSQKGKNIAVRRLERWQLENINSGIMTALKCESQKGQKSGRQKA